MRRISPPTVAEEQHMGQTKADSYLVLLRRELTRAQARLRRCERERDALRAALEEIRNKKRGQKSKSEE